jgi:ankyrin repeat protein
VQLLINNEANVNAEGGHYSSPLQAALAYGREDIIQLLVDNGTNVNAKGREDSNSLRAAPAKRD